MRGEIEQLDGPEDPPRGAGGVLDADRHVRPEAGPGPRRAAGLRPGDRGRAGLGQPRRRPPGARDRGHLVRDRLAADPAGARAPHRDRRRSSSVASRRTTGERRDRRCPRRRPAPDRATHRAAVAAEGCPAAAPTLGADDDDHARPSRAPPGRPSPRAPRRSSGSSGALRDGHFLLKSGRHSDAYLEKFAVLSDPAATSELCALLGRPAPGADDRPTVDLVAGPTTGGVILAFETGRQLGTRAIFAEEVKGDGPPRREFRRGFRIEPGRARPARRRHPHDRRLAPGDDPGGRGGGRRDRRVRRPGRPIRRAQRPRLADDRPALPAQRALDPRPADVRARARDCPRCAAGEPVHAPGSTGAAS